MSAVTIAALVGLAGSLAARRGGLGGGASLDDWAMALGVHAGLTAMVATGLAWLGWLRPGPLAMACVVLALACWPWRDRARRAAASSDRATTLALLVVVALGSLLRSPPIEAPLAGRDQGTYALRAQLSARTGELSWLDPVLAEAGAELGVASPPAGVLDLLGLYPSDDAPWRAGVYEAAYRPGSYLADRERGVVTPQFFHLHPMLLAVGVLAFGPLGVGVASLWVSGLWLLALACVARSLWPRGPAAVLAVALVALSPLAIWTGRTPLSENPMALLEALALLAALRIAGREPAEAGDEPWWLAACLALSAGVRGNALMILPLVLALMWLRPRGQGRGAGAARLVLLGLVATIVVHGLTSYPYVHDEIVRRLPGELGGPGPLIAASLVAALAWLGVDAWLARARWDQLRARIVARAPLVMAVALGLGVLAWIVLRLTSPAGPPHSRLDAAPILLGLPLCSLALVGAGWLGWRWRPEPAATWLVCLAAIVPATVLIYAPRQLPTLAFFYYGRYLVPELLVAASLAAVYALVEVHALVDRRGSRPAAARVVVGALGLALLTSVALPLIRSPQLRLREYEPAGDALEWLAARVPEDAIVIAGGEGWHSGHTHNQVGGALAMGYGRALVPYRTREDAYLSAWELLVAGPARRGEAPPPVYLLINEAAHPYTRDEGQRVAVVDDMLWAPFAAGKVELLELYVHALSPVADALPTRVARHELRMALVELRVDPEALDAIAVTRFEGEDTCVAPDRVLRLELPRPADASHIVVEAGDVDLELARVVPRWRVRVDGHLLAFEAPGGLRSHPRASLGPAVLPPPEPGRDTMRVEIRGVARPRGEAREGACPHGRLAALRLLPRERGWLDTLDPDAIEAVTFAPARDLGHAVEPIAWVGGRALNRYRPGTDPPPRVRGLALVIEAGESVEFAPVDLPVDAGGEPAPLDLVVTLARTQTTGPAQLLIWSEGALIAELEVPAERPRSWVAPPVAWTPPRARAAVRVELRAAPKAAGGGAVELRDVALFERSVVVESRL